MIFGERSYRITYPMLQLTLCVSCWKEVRSHVCRSHGCDIITGISYMHHAGAGFLEWRWPNIPAHCCMPCTIMQWDPVPTTLISGSTSRRENKKTPWSSQHPTFTHIAPQTQLDVLSSCKAAAPHYSARTATLLSSHFQPLQTKHSTARRMRCRRPIRPSFFK